MEPFLQLLDDSTLPSGLIADAAALRQTALQMPGWSQALWKETVTKWFVNSLSIQLPSLQDRWTFFKPLFGASTEAALEVFVKVAESYYSQSSLYSWPPTYDGDVRSVLEDILPPSPPVAEIAPLLPPTLYPTSGKRSRYRPIVTTMELRSKKRGGFNANKDRSNHSAAFSWTVGSAGIQAYMRRDPDKEWPGGPYAPAESLMRYMRKTAAQSPRGAISGVKYLHRLIGHSFAKKLQDDGYLDDKGFMAFTTSDSPRTLRLALNQVAAGTPWIWYGHGHNPTACNPREEEVLLPPGRVTAIPLPPGEAPLLSSSINVKYVPLDSW
ncbi:MAG: hypothetical protein EOO40_05230 [Deltaproteobacteria bacterium]|nr:MAG: hypothetical protein EOO40_05230 [Deltaproteobacteria bacterium]